MIWGNYPISGNLHIPLFSMSEPSHFWWSVFGEAVTFPEECLLCVCHAGWDRCTAERGHSDVSGVGWQGDWCVAGERDHSLIKKKRALQCCFLILAATVLASYLFVQYNLVHIIVFVDQILVTIMLSESANYAHRGQNMLTPVKTQTTVRQGCSNSFGWSMIDTFGGSMAHFISIFDPIFAPHSRPRMERYKSSLLLCRWEEVPVRAFTPRKVLRVIRTA